jgi:DNA-binding SARP family transcriptional activator
LRFSEREIERLFRDTYGRPLEADVVNDLSQRTEGWAACLQLVQAALRDRTPTKVRAFVQGLSGIDENLYDYLAEEVVGELDDEMQQFLMQTSILRVVDPELTEILTGFDAARARRLIEAAEKIGLLSRRGEATRHSQRYHTLVRQFLEERLRRTVGDERVRELHRAVARHADGTNWGLAAHHYEAAGDIADVHRVIESSALEIMSAADYSAVADWLDRYPPATERSIHRIARSRVRYYGDRLDQAVEDAEEAARLAESEGGLAAELAQLNLISQRFNLGNGRDALALARILSAAARDSTVRDIARAYVLMSGVSDGDSVVSLKEHLEAMAVHQLENGRLFFAGVSLLNCAVVFQSLAQPGPALELAKRAFGILHDGQEVGPEAAAAAAIIGWAHAYRGEMDLAWPSFSTATSVGHRTTRVELLAELADVHLWFGKLSDAQVALDRADAIVEGARIRDAFLTPTRAEIMIRFGDAEKASRLLSTFEEVGPIWSTGRPARVLYLKALAARVTGEPSWLDMARRAEAMLARQGVVLWRRQCQLLVALGEEAHRCDRIVRAVGVEDRSALSMAAEIVAEVLPSLTTPTMEFVSAEARLRPERWRNHIRESLSHGNAAVQLFGGSVLDVIGEAEDVMPLRLLSKRLKQAAIEPRLGKGLARRLAEPVYVEDQGRVRVRVGNREIDGSSIRRKVLALLCFLVSRPGFSATRDQVLEALWPDLQPEIAANSLHQTVYFLRRIFEPRYKEESSADYVHHEADVVWLDRDLIGSRTSDCLKVLDDLRLSDDPDLVARLSEMYKAPFALDFAYEDWAAGYRTSVHAEYVRVVEDHASSDADGGHTERAISLLTRALQVDPDADQLELQLLRVYRRTGSHAAAAERYQHYASVMRDQLGIEPPALDSL